LNGKDELYNNLFDLIGYMLSSARGLVAEPQIYGPFRLVEGVSRLCGILEVRDTAYGDFFSKLKTKIDEKKYSLMTDENAFIELMDDLVLDFTRKMNAT
jgi:hypothetical protein